MASQKEQDLKSEQYARMMGYCEGEPCQYFLRALFAGYEARRLANKKKEIGDE